MVFYGYCPVTTCFFFDQRTERFFYLPANKVPGLTCIREGPDGDLWGNGTGQVWYRLRFPAGCKRAEECVAGLQVDRYPLSCREEPGEVRCMSPGKASVWIGAENGIYETSHGSDNCFGVENLPLRGVDGIWADTSDGAVWLYKDERLYRWADGRLRSFDLDSRPLMRMPAGVSNGRFTCFFSGHSIYQWRDGQLQRLPWEIPEGIMSACIDREGVLWVGTNASGLRKIALDRYDFKVFGAGLSMNRQPVSDAGGQLWLSASRQVSPNFRRFDWRSDQPAAAFAPGKNINYLLRSSRGIFWFATTGHQLCHTDRPGGALVCDSMPKGIYTELQEGPGGCLLLGRDDNTFARFDPEERKWTTHSFARFTGGSAGVEVKVMAFDKTGRIWIGTTAGLLLATPRKVGDGYDFRRFTAQQAGPLRLTHNHVLALLPDPDDPELCWVGTAGGLDLIDLRRGECRQLTAQEGLTNAVVCAILPDGPYHIWFATYFGLYVLHKPTFSWQRFTKVDGLPANEFNHRAALRLPDGRLLFGGVNGFMVFDPQPIRGHSELWPRLTLTNLFVGHQKILAGDSTGILQSALPFTKSLVLKHDQDDIQFQFALLDYLNPAGSRYMYRLRGHHDDWYETTSEGRAAYYNLPSGSYLLEARARNSHGAFSQLVALDVTVLRPWWKTGWAYFLYASLSASAILMIGLTWLGRRRIARRLLAERREAERLRELEQFKTRLFSNYTHEFRTPLTIISSLAGQLRSLSKGAARKLVGDIEQQAHDLLRLTGQILDLAKLDENRLILRAEPVDLADYVSGLCSGFKSLAESKNITCFWELPDEPVWADTDVSRLRDILYNLMSNAIKFTPEGGKVSLKLEPATSGVVAISVRDTGIGIAPEYLEKIFERHYQVLQDGSVVQGTGIGLSHAAELTRAMGGRITVESEPGKGSVFTLHLPVIPVVSAAAKPARPKAGVLPVQLSYPEQPQVLIVEDNVEIAKIIAGYLSPDFNVDFAGNGRQGLEKAVEQLPDIVLCDLRMPEIDGIAFCRTLRANPQTSHIPVVMLTAFIDEAIQLQAMEAGASAWLTKPVHPEVLRRQLNSFLQLRRQLQQRILQSVEAPGPPAAAPEWEKEQQFVRQVMAVIANRFDDPDFSVSELQQALNLSKSQLHRKLLSLTGHPAIWFIRKYRLEEARKLLRSQRHLTVAEIAYRVGFTDPNYFSRAFSAEFGQKPSAVRM